MFATKKHVVAAENVRRNDLFPCHNKMTLIVDTRISKCGNFVELDFVAAGDQTGYVHGLALRPQHKVKIIRSKK